jgi:iron complex outermembrane recepter protein
MKSSQHVRTGPAALICATAGVLACLAAGEAVAQEATAESANESTRLGEVLVTAQKRAESLQSVPVSVTALTSTQLNEVKMDTPSDLTTQIPNLQVNGIVGEGSPLFALRGVSMFDYSLSQSSPVGSYIDEVYKGNFVLFGVEMYDLDRIEVLRGPQGTLYGKNTTGGAINFITKKPGFSDEGYVTIGAGNYNRREAEGAAQFVLISDKLSARVAATYTKVDGFIHNLLPGYPDMEGVDQYGFRVSLLYKPMDTLEFWLRYSQSMQDPQNYAIIDGCVTPPISPSCYGQPGGPTGGVGYTGYYRTNTGAYNGQPLPANQIALDFTKRRRQDNQALALTANWTMSDALALTSITSWDLGSLLNPEGTDGAPIDIFKIPYYGKTRQVTQDLRLTSNSSGPFNYIVGAYYQHEVIHNNTANYIFTDPAFGMDCAANTFPGGAWNGALINLGCQYWNNFDQYRNSWAVYSDASYQLNPLFKLRVGVRYNHDNGTQKNAISQLRTGVPAGDISLTAGTPIGNIIPGTTVNGVWQPVEALPGSPNYESVVNATTAQALHNIQTTGRVGVDFTPTHDTLYYLSYSHGYRSAAFNGQFFFSINDFSQVLPETIDAYEVGAKTAWVDNRLQLNGAVFYYQYKNQQYIDVYPTGQQPLINLPKSRIEGGELELVARPWRPLTLHAGIGALDTRIQEAAIQGGKVDVAGHQLPYAPKWSGTLSADWEALSRGAVGLTLHVDGVYSSAQYFELVNQPRLQEGGYGQLNARATLHDANDKWSVGAWVRNATDKLYWTNIVDLQGFGYDYRHRGLPRMYGADVTYRF